MEQQINHLLTILEYPLLRELNVNDTSSIINLMLWLEDTKIRLWEIEARESLRFHIGDDENKWASKYSEYLEHLSCPHSWFSHDCIYWVAAHAIHLSLEDLEYRDNDNEGEGILDDDRLGYDSVVDFVDDLCEGVGLKTKLAESCPESMERIHATIQSKLIPQSNVDFEFPLGFNTNDEVVDRVALVLKMLHLDEFRNVQNNVNEVLSLCQSYTANPKLNSSLGKVGR